MTTCCVIYLDEEVKNSQLAIKMLRKIEKAKKFITSDQKWLWLSSELTSLSSSDHQTWTAIWTLIWHFWFNRVWIIQEFVSSANVEIICEQWNIQWKQLLKSFTDSLMYWLLDHAIDNRNASIHSVNSAAVKVISCLIIMKTVYETSKRFSNLHDLIYSSWLADATKTHDHLFAFLGLIHDEDDETLASDYIKSLESVVQQYALFFIQKYKTLHVIRIEQHHHIFRKYIYIYILSISFCKISITLSKSK